MPCLVVILARAGSKGLTGKNALPCAGRPLLAWTIDHALRSQAPERVVVSTDGTELKAVAASLGVEAVHRPHKLADDTATVDAAARQAVLAIDPDAHFDEVVILYGNVPVRPADLTDRAVAKLRDTGCDSVQSVCPVGKHHPYWMKELAPVLVPGTAAGCKELGDVLLQHVPNRVYRRQDLPPLYELDGGVIAVTRDALFTTDPDEPHAFLGTDRRAVVTGRGEVVDVDEELDLIVAEAILSRSVPATRAAG